MNPLFVALLLAGLGASSASAAVDPDAVPSLTAGLCPEEILALERRMPEATAAFRRAVRDGALTAQLPPEEAERLAEALSFIAEGVTRSVLRLPRPPFALRNAELSDRVTPSFPATFVEGDYATVDPYGSALVPWLAAHGPFAYSPDALPSEPLEVFADYGRLIPSAFAGHSGLFGSRSSAAYETFFWEQAKRGRLRRIAVHEGRLDADHRFRAPVAIYEDPDSRHYVLVQGGNLQFLPVASQPDLETRGVLRLFRGIYDRSVHEFVRHEGETDRETEILRTFRGLWNWYVSSRSDLAFSVPYAGSARSETDHIHFPIAALRDFDAFAGRFLDASDRAFAERHMSVLPEHRGNRWTFDRAIAELRFGPNVVAIETPVTNVRFTGSWNSEGEAHLVEPDRLELRPEESSPGVTVRGVRARRRR